MSLTLLAVGAVVAAMSGLVVAPLIGSLPEPDPTAPTSSAVSVKEPYADIGRLRNLTVWAVVVCAVAGATIGASLDRAADLVLWLPLVPVGVALALIDLRTKLLPVRLVLPATAYVLVAGVVIAVLDRDPDALIRGLIGLVVARSFFWVLWRIYPRGMGFGDVRLAAVLGFVLAHAGWAEFGIGMYAGFPMLGVPGLLLALLKWDRAELKKAYPFGPAMLAGALLGLSVGEPLVSALFGT
ncbi:hypothetical protein GCM10027020_23180 [Nocardioides salsibiostraticola]